jgi:exosortase
LAFGALWFLLFAQVSGEWSIVPQYSYGWAVPALGAWVFWNRWQSRPVPLARQGGRSAAVLALLLMLALGPTRLVQEGNRDWRLVSWLLAIEVAGLCLLALWHAGGSGWGRHFLFALLFPLVSVPWPSQLEVPLIHEMMRFVAGTAAMALNQAGVFALAQGNIIMLGAGPVGVDEACSGIQSFQAAVMVSLFLGELFGFLTAERVRLFLFAIIWALVCNVSRTLFLCVMAHRDGLEAVSRWHDTAGYALMALCYGGIFGLAMWWDRQAETETVELSPSPVSARTVPTAWLAGGLVWLVVVGMATGWWYRRGEVNFTPRQGWTVQFPDEPAFKAKDFSERERTLLRYNEADGREWVDKQGHRWTLNFFRWETGNAGADNAKYHRPTVCLADIGYELQTTFPPREVVVKGVRLPVRQYRFTAGSQMLDSFYCLWDELGRPGYTDLSDNWDPANWSAHARLMNVLAGRRGGGLQLLNASVVGAETPEAAAADFQQEIEQIIVPR